MKKIMLVDDEEDQIFGIQTALEETYGDEYQIIPAGSGKECFELLNEGDKRPDLILLDIMMPKMSGWEVYDKLRDNPTWSDIPIVFLTARTDRIAENAGEFLGDDYVEKPVEIADLRNRIEKVLEKKKQDIQQD
jgi:CheY-like chemotaxis protein